MQNHATKHLGLFFVVVVALSCKTTILLVIGVTFECLINQTGVDHLSTFFVFFLFFVLPATLQMQISLSKLSSVFQPECCEQCLHIFL